MANCTTTSRLIYAKKKGLINNFSSKVCAIGFNDIQCFETLGIKKLTICHPEKSVIKKAFALNHLTFVDLNGFTTRKIQVFDQTFVNITKSRKETLFNIAVAFFITKIDGNIVINGDKELGIDFYCKKIGTLTNLIFFSKSHGKISFSKKTKFIPNEIKIWKNYGKYRKIYSNYYTLPGCFSEKEIDDGSNLLVKNFSNNLYGKVTDLGAGWGYLSAKALENNNRIKEISLVESNLNSLKCSKINVSSLKAKFYWTDLEEENLSIRNCDHVIMNPPFHKGKQFIQSLGFVFLKTAKKILKKKGTLWMVHNKELNYENSVNDLFQNYKYIDITKNYKIIKAIKCF